MPKEESLYGELEEVERKVDSALTLLRSLQDAQTQLSLDVAQLRNTQLEQSGQLGKILALLSPPQPASFSIALSQGEPT
jgi:hypothetical protein